MKKTDMELQAIREKLLQLQAEPTATDVLSAPWATPQQSSHAQSSYALSEAAYRQQLAAQPSATSGSEADSPQAAALKALQGRSGNPSSARQTAASAQADSMITLEIDRLQVLANNINERSQQQASEILAMKRSAQQAAVALRRQGIHSHPGLQIIEQFLASYPSASVPLLERDSQGQFCLNHSVVDLHQAEQEASTIAQELRRRQSGVVQSGFAPSEQIAEQEQATHSRNSTLFAQPIEQDMIHRSEDEFSEPLTERRSGSKRRRKGGLKTLLSPIQSLLRLMGNRKENRRDAIAHTQETHKRSPFSSSFSWTDAAIWFSGAAIARIVLEAVVVSMPLLRMPVLLVLFSAISFSIYRVVVAKSTDMPSVYRLAITLLGLIVGGSL